MNLGVRRGEVLLVEYCTKWKEAYEIEKIQLLPIFKNKIVQLEHIGSTSIPNLQAKPLIDMALLVANLEVVDSCCKELETLSYIERIGRLKGKQRVFAKTIDGKVTHHLHIIEEGERDWLDKITFKKALINDPKLIVKYNELKASLYHQFKTDRLAYTNGKAAFIQSILRK